MTDNIEDGYWWVKAEPGDLDEFIVKVDKSWVLMAGISGWAKTEDFVFLRKAV